MVVAQGVTMIEKQPMFVGKAKSEEKSESSSLIIKNYPPVWTRADCRDVTFNFKARKKFCWETSFKLIGTFCQLPFPGEQELYSPIVYIRSRRGTNESAAKFYLNICHSWLCNYQDRHAHCVRDSKLMCLNHLRYFTTLINNWVLNFALVGVCLCQTWLLSEAHCDQFWIHVFIQSMWVDSRFTRLCSTIHYP